MDDQNLTETIERQESPSLDAIPPKPDFIGPYKIESLLNHGGMSLLYLGIDPKTSLSVAIKVVLPKYLKSKEMLTRLLREAKILSVAAHPNIVRLYDLGRSEQGLFIAMEYVQGISLRQFIKTKALTHKRALEIILQIAYALAHLHSQQIIHRDLKPENILITESGNIKVIDFGISEFVASRDIDQKTEKKSRIGTPHYMSPEQKENPEKVSYTSDLFSLGIIAYELYLGRLAHGVIQPAILPRGLEKILSKTLALDPENRYHDIVDFIADLSQFLQRIDKEEKRTSPEELYRLLEDTRKMLLPRSPPKWTNVKIGLAFQEGEAYGSYLDFLSLLPNRFAVLFARPISANANALMYASMLRGIVRMAATQIAANPIPTFLETLNRVLCNEAFSHPFDFSLLFLDVEHNLLAFGSSHSNVLCHSAQGAKLRTLDAENPPLGRAANSSFLEVKENWNMGDLLLFSSSPIDLSRLPSNLLFDPKNLATKMLDLIVPSHEEAVLIAIERR